MAEKTLILAKSGSGKTTSLQNLDFNKSIIIQAIAKRLPFENGRNWKLWDKESQTGSRYVTRDLLKMKPFMQKMADVGKKIIVIDDFVYTMAGKVMDDIDDKGYDKWTELAKEVYDLFEFIDTLPEDVRVYIMTHVDEDVNGNLKMKTAGKLLENLITPEGMFNTVFGASFEGGKYKFKTNKDRGSEPFKSPMGMFTDLLIDNDLKTIDDRLVEYYGIEETKQKES